MGITTLKGERIHLRRLHRKDIGSIQKYANDKKITRFIPFIPFPYTLNDARKFVNLAHRMERINKAFNFGIISNTTNELIGIIGLKNINHDDLNAEVECWIGSRYWRKGITSEALYLIMRFAFEKLALKRIYGIVSELNIASVGLLEKLGFKREGCFRNAHRSKSKWFDVYGYGILKEEF